MNSSELLTEWCRFGWRFRKIGDRPQKDQDWYASRVKYELDMMLSKDMADFFLATSDMVRWAKDSGIPVGPGRGSVAASVVAWLLRITEVDPIRYPQLLFERFMDVTRTDPPDIDLDFEDERRHEVFEYMARKYGADCVGSVANFTHYRAKNALDDVARVYNVPKWAKEQFSSLIVERSGLDIRMDSGIEDTIGMFPAAAKIMEQFPDLRKAAQLEGNMRGMNIHAGGMIVANSPLTDLFAVYERDGRRVLSADKHDVEYAGALKMDVLGLTTMGIISSCLEMAGLTLDDLYAIPDDDPDALAMFKKGDVVGIFQFEGRATRLVCRDVSPDNFEEVIDINSLSRPGPLLSGSTAEYVAIKHGRQKLERLHPLIDEITGPTRGQIVYQEQVLRVVREVGGFDWTKAVEIRRIISKKYGEAAMAINADSFMDGCERLHGIDRKIADKVWKRIVTSGAYTFNYAHSVSYCMLSLWCAWLKAHYPVEFYAAALSKSDKDQQFRLLKDASAHGIAISPPVLNASRRQWRGANGILIAGWEQIPGIAEKTGRRIDKLRWGPDGGKFTSWDDMTRIPGIGAKTVDKMREFSERYDPFELKLTDNRISRVKNWIKTQSRVPMPTHTGAEIAAIYMEETGDRKKFVKGPEVIYAGIVQSLNMQDAVENRRARTGEEAEDILKTLKRPDLLEFCSLRCHDVTDEEIYLRVNRFAYPRLKRAVQRIKVNHDVVIAVGNRIAGFGTPVMVNELYVVDPD